MRKKICVVLPDLRLGGAQRVLLDLARQFSRVGHQVDVVTLVADGHLSVEMPSDVRHLPLQRVAKRGIAVAIFSFPKLVRHLLATRPDAVLSSMTGTNLLVAVAHTVAGGQSRLVLREAASLQNTSGRLIRWLMGKLYRRADALIGVSGGVAEELAEVVKGAVPVHAVHNPVDSDRIQRAARAKLDECSPTKPYIVSVARLTAQKDQETLIQAYVASASSRTHRLVVVGNGEDRDRLGSLVRELGLEHRVDFVGALVNPYPVLAGAALHVLSSRWEGYPNVLLEALVLGVPIVATDCPFGPRELLRDGRLGSLVPVADHTAMAKAIDAELMAPVAKDDSYLDAHRPEVVAGRYLALLL